MHAAFLADICAAPGDDDLRRIYADWLEEQGGAAQAQSEFIRVQLERARLPEDDPQQAALADRERRLLAAYEADWVDAALPGVAGWEFARGFIDELILGEANLDACQPLFARHPIRRVRFLPSVAPSESLADSPLLGRLAGLTFERQIPSGELAPLLKLLAAPSLRGLSELAVRVQPGLDPFAEGGPPLLRVRVDPDLYAPVSSAGDAVAELLAGSLGRASLTRLELAGALSDHGAARLIDSRHLASLTELHLETCFLTDRTLLLLTAPAHAPRWSALSLTEFCFFSAAGLARLAACERLARLRLGALPNQLSGLASLPRLARLDLRLSPFDAPVPSRELADLLGRLPPGGLRLQLLGPGDEHLLELARLPHLDRLGGLQLRSCAATNAGVQALAGCSELTRLTELQVGHASGVTDDSAAALADSPALAGLTHLHFWQTPIHDRGVTALTCSPHLGRLTVLHLFNVGLGPRGVAALAAWPGLARLDELDLSGNGLDDTALRPLAESPHLRPFTRLRLLYNPVSVGLAEAFRQRLGWRRLDVGPVIG